MEKFSKDIDEVIKTMEAFGFTLSTESAIDTQNKYFLNKSDLYFTPPKKLKIGKYGQVALVMEVSNKNFFPLNIFPALQLTVAGSTIFLPGMHTEGFHIPLRGLRRAGEKENRLGKSMDKINWIIGDFQEKVAKLAELEVGSNQKADETLQKVLRGVVETRFSNIFNHKMSDIISINFIKTKTWDLVKLPAEFKTITKSSEAENVLEAMIATQYNFCFSESFVFQAFAKNKDNETVTMKAKSIKQNYRNTIFKRLIANIYFENFFEDITEVRRFEMKNYFNI